MHSNQTRPVCRHRESQGMSEQRWEEREWSLCLHFDLLVPGASSSSQQSHRPINRLPVYIRLSWISSPAIKSIQRGTSLVAQWLRICLPMQGTQVRSLVWEDPTCRGAAKPVHHNYWACALEPTSHNYWARVPQLLKPACLEPVLHNKRSHRNEKPVHRNQE